MTYSVTIFKPPRWWDEQQRFVYDNKTHRRMDFGDWNKFTNFLKQLSERPLNGKQDAELISPAVFKDDSPRRNANVLAWAGWAAVDVDDHEITGDLEHELVQRYGVWDYVCYSTASSTNDHPKFRLIFRLDAAIPGDQIKHFWYALNSELDSIGDKQTKDLARMYYIPANYAAANNFFYVNKGQAIDVNYLLARWPYDERKDSKNFMDRLPDAWREQIMEYRKGRLDNTDIVWSTYMDCPFVSKRLLEDYKMIANVDGSGRYRMIYKMMISIAGNAVEKGYPISVAQIVDLIKQIDRDTANRYQNRPLDVEANNALEYVYKNGVIK